MDQHRSPDQPVDRDRAVRRAGRLRRTLVGTSAAASLGIAAVLGISALDNGSTSAAQSSRPAAPARARRAAARPAPPGAPTRAGARRLRTCRPAAGRPTPRRAGPEMTTTAAVEWELWSTRARLVVTDPGVLSSRARAGRLLPRPGRRRRQPVPRRQRDLPARRALRRGDPVPDDGATSSPRRWPPRSSPTATSTRRSAVRCAASATTATCSWSPVTPARCAR